MQVYRARLVPALGGGEIAIKVQRPALREAIALDLLLMRKVALFAGRFPEVRFLHSFSCAGGLTAEVALSVDI